MRQIDVIGIGAGDPGHLTLQAVAAIARADVFFLLDKGEAKDSMIRLRRDILAAHARPGHRVAEGRDPDRDRTPADYTGTIADWRTRRAAVMAGLIADLADGETGAFLVWGDPALYDSTIAILDEILSAGGVPFTYTVVPGVSSVSALAARHRTGLNRVGRPFQVTTGRRLAEGWPDGVDDVVVMLDAQQAFTAYTGQDVHIYWGAYLGTPDEIAVEGPLAEVADEILRVRAEARERHGWIMDTYLLRRGGS
ncbi:precorrin-6A synthase (deacetylating) [Spirilliplanes yamanashiensis]|uniref:Precorrin-6A synthase (Deacetylating) n=1 Tax=Spirilliplanes yamanashiensis TaxID=42233 RepID=A0A8J3Y795_9ACTN|nr:precorrin-6A synthase (deacetylating) [Spirilliplanes yamanashiensis]MDP9817523.1 precorrin-6A synthase [Spirilliplanes yamanashiensis]GIJ02824.1 precorrin-6A synthase (deacetylating) [Spirilliplanes yamanashiensis]